MTVDVSMGAVYSSALVNFNLTSHYPLSSGKYLSSYAHDSQDPNVYTGSNYYTLMSYFYPAWAVSSCYYSSSCSAVYKNKNETELLSLAQLKLSSYFYNGNYLSSIQVQYSSFPPFILFMVS